MRTAFFRVVLGYIAALLSIATRIGRHRSSSNASASSPSTSSSEESFKGWSDALISDAPQSQRLLLSRDGVEDREGLATEWRAIGRTAMTAIASASQLSVDLVTLGAPPTLIANANEDALDEIRHAKICFALARAIDGRDASSMASTTTLSSSPIENASQRTLPKARTLLIFARGLAAASRPRATLAVIAASRLEAALTEGLSARMNAKLARRAIDKSIRAALEEIALVEARHATHAWAVIEWCLAEGGNPPGGSVVEHALRAAQTMLTSSNVRMAMVRTKQRDIPCIAAEGGWERWGIAGGALEHQELAAAHDANDKRVASLLARSRRLTPSGRLAAA